MRQLRDLVLRPFVLSLSALLFDCATLEKLDPGTCGNGVVDATEDCDGTAGCGTSSDGAASCRLKCTAAKDCPEGWGCGISGVCRQPSGQFALISEPLSAGVDTVDVGDFDGDGRMDVLAGGLRGANNAARVRVHYFGDGAALSQVISFAAPLASPFVRDFDGDGVADFAFGYSGLNLVRGQRDRSFAVNIFPSVTLEQSVRAVYLQGTTRKLPDGSSATYLFHGAVKTQQGEDISVLASTSGSEYAVGMPAGPDKLLGDPAWGTVLDAVPRTSCGDVVLALDMGNTTKVLVVTPCVGDLVGEGSSWGDKPPVELTFPAKLTRGILLADVDNDGHVDVLGGTEETVFVARNTNGIAFADPEEIKTGNPLKLVLPELPLAAGDFNGDGIVDYVLRRNFQLSRPFGGGGDGGAAPSFVYVPIPSPRGGNWSRALITHVNGDPYPDIVVASAEQPDLEVFAGTGDGNMTPYTISTNGAVSRFAIGDLDGDQIQDIAFVETRASGDSDIAVAYGRLVGSPEASRSIGRVSEVTALNAFPTVGTAVNSLGVFMRTGGTSAADPVKSSFAIIVGSGDRQPLAPLLFDESKALPQHQPKRDDGQARAWLPHTVLAGSVVVPGRVDLVSVAIGATFGRFGRERGSSDPVGGWVAPGSGPLSFDSLAEVVPLDGLGFRLGEAEVLALQATVADLSTPLDGTDEIVALAGVGGGGAAGLSVISAKNGVSPLKTIPISGARVAPHNRLAVVDVDGDGRRDAVVIVATSGGTEASVYLNDGQGSFVTTPIAVSIPAWSKPGAPPDTSPTGVSQITIAGTSTVTGSTRRRDLAITTARRVLLASFDAEKKSFVVRELADRIGDEGLSEGTAVAAGDLDGDGVEDLAIADRGALRVLRQLPRLP